MALNENTPRYCDICGCEKVYTRRVTRSTYTCPHSQDKRHVEARRHRRELEAIANIERQIGSAS